jgi:predicted glycoside hydrolase/deacetylase ChbG (UPF0249 family)
LKKREPVKRLVVTADDVGLHPGMTLGALAAHDGGVVTAVSVAPCGRAFEHAMDRLRDRPALDLGAHLVLVGERPLSPPREIGSLVTGDGLLHSGYPAFAARCFLGRIDMGHVERELRRQLERLLATGVPVVHLNSHQHLHLLPRLFDVVLRLAQEHRIPFVRVPAEPAVARSGSFRAAQLALLNRLGRRARRRLGGGVAALETTLGVLDAGRLTVERFRRALDDFRGAGAGSTGELVCHPGLGDADLAAAYPWRYAWDQETAALRDPRLSGMLCEAGIELTSFSRCVAA